MGDPECASVATRQPVAIASTRLISPRIGFSHNSRLRKQEVKGKSSFHAFKSITDDLFNRSAMDEQPKHGLQEKHSADISVRPYRAHYGDAHYKRLIG